MEKLISKPNELCDVAIGAAQSKAKLKGYQMMILGFLAGAFIALGGICSAAASHAIENPSSAKFVGASVFPIGLILVVICGAELFTGNCTMITGVLEKKITTKEMLKNWGIVYLANFLGSVFVAFLVYKSGALGANNGKLGATVIKVASTKGGLEFGSAFASGILCNLMVCLAVWGAFAATTVASKVLVIWFPIMGFVVAGFEHSVANMYFMTVGIFAKGNAGFVKASGLTADKLSNVSFGGMIHNLIPVTLGNIVGGALLVGAFYWITYKYKPSTSVSVPSSKAMDK